MDRFPHLVPLIGRGGPGLQAPRAKAAPGPKGPFPWYKDGGPAGTSPGPRPDNRNLTD
jgi:hypothetical protein